MKKPYELGIIVGRFQVFHTGHEQLINKAIELCDTVGVFIGSSQESGTIKNPFSYKTRKKILKKVFGDDIIIYPLPDSGIGNVSKWGEYVYKNVVKYFSRPPELLISGKEEKRLNWFDSVIGLSVAELYIPKIIDISATEMRKHFPENEIDEWKKYTNPKLWDYYRDLQKIIIDSQNNTETESM